MAKTEAGRKWYSDKYLKSDHWQSLRTAKLCEVGFKCQNCKTTRRLEVHHRKYNPYKESLSDLRVLCEDCHFRAHDIDQYRYAPKDRNSFLNSKMEDLARDFKHIVAQAVAQGIPNAAKIARRLFSQKI